MWLAAGILFFIGGSPLLGIACFFIYVLK